MAQASTEDWLASVRRRKTKEYSVRAQRPRGENPSIIRPKNLNELHGVMEPSAKRAKPIRPLGAGSAATACATAAGGTVIDMTSMDDIVNIGDDTVTVQAGVRIAKLADALEQHGKEIPGCIDLVNRTVGGAVASACIGPSLARDGGNFSSQVVALKAITPQGKLLTVDQRRGKLLEAYRLSYGMLGVIYEVTLKIRPLTSFVRKQKKMDVKSFTHAAERLAGTDVGIKFYLMPFKNQVFTELRRHEVEAADSKKQPWKLKDWGETAALPKICGKLSSVVPIASLRYSLADSLHGVSQSLLGNSLVSGGDAVEQGLSTTGSFAMPPLCYSTWCFTATDLTMVLHGYIDFCRRYYKEHRFRCDSTAELSRASLNPTAGMSQ
ncbi:MAG: FAD-binding oxidoreductase, partial [Pseudomonadota bacterium]